MKLKPYTEVLIALGVISFQSAAAGWFRRNAELVKVLNQMQNQGWI